MKSWGCPLDFSYQTALKTISLSLWWQLWGRTDLFPTELVLKFHPRAEIKIERRLCSLFFNDIAPLTKGQVIGRMQISCFKMVQVSLWSTHGTLTLHLRRSLPSLTNAITDTPFAQKPFSSQGSPLVSYPPRPAMPAAVHSPTSLKNQPRDHVKTKQGSPEAWFINGMPLDVLQAQIWEQ